MRPHGREKRCALRPAAFEALAAAQRRLVAGELRVAATRGLDSGGSSVSAEPTSGGNALLSDRLKAAGRAALAPVVNVLAAAGVTPNTVTVAGLVLVTAASFLIWQRSLLLGAALLAIGAALDAVDGGLARARGGGTPFGAFLDSTSIGPVKRSCMSASSPTG